jgi:hypothetical protein
MVVTLENGSWEQLTGVPFEIARTAWMFSVFERVRSGPYKKVAEYLESECPVPDEPTEKWVHKFWKLINSLSQTDYQLGLIIAAMKRK